MRPPVGRVSAARMSQTLTNDFSRDTYPGGEATVDGMPQRIYRTDYLLRGVFVPAGRHRVVCAYRPATLATGAAISAIALLFLVVLAVWCRYRRR